MQVLFSEAHAYYLGSTVYDGGVSVRVMSKADAVIRPLCDSLAQVDMLSEALLRDTRLHASIALRD